MFLSTSREFIEKAAAEARHDYAHFTKNREMYSTPGQDLDCVYHFYVKCEQYNVDIYTDLDSCVASLINAIYAKLSEYADYLSTLSKLDKPGREKRKLVIRLDNTVSRNKGVKDWVTKNPPQYHEPTTEYYSRYLGAVKCGVSNNTFAKIVRSNGYNRVQIHSGIRYWRN